MQIAMTKLNLLESLHRYKTPNIPHIGACQSGRNVQTSINYSLEI